MFRFRAAQALLHAVTLFVTSALSVILLSSCGGRLKDVGGESRFVEDVYWAEAETEYQDFGGYYELKERRTTIEWDSGHWATTTNNHSVIVVLDAKKMKEFADFTIKLPPGSQLIELEAATISSEGRVTEVRDSYERNAAPGFMLYSEIKEKVFAMPKFEDRCILDVKYQLKTWAPNLDDGFWFAATIPVKRAVYSYIVSSTLTRLCDLSYKFYNLDTRVPDDMAYRTVNDLVHEFTWVIEEVDAFPYEKWMPPVEFYAPRIQLTGDLKGCSYCGWDGFAEWYYEILKDQCDLPAELRNEMLKIRDEIPDSVEKMKRIRDILAQDYRYVAIGLNDTQWKPNKPAEVCRNRYGDCKDLSTLAVCMLREAGLEACQALVLTKDRGKIDRSLSIPRFNHMIVYIEDLDMWMDPTLGRVPLNMLHHYERGVDALLIKGESAIWKQTPADPPFSSTKRAETLISVMSDGAVVGNSKVTYEGDLALALLKDYQGATDQEIEQGIRDAAQDYVVDGSVQDCKLSKLEEIPPGVTAVAQFNRPRTAFRLEDQMALRLDFLKPSLLRTAAEFEGADSRRYAVSFPYPWSEAETICVDIPAGWEVAAVPEAAESTGPWGSFRIEYALTGNQVIVSRDFSLKRETVGLDELERFIDFWKEARNLAGQELILKKQS
jgi:hypothetical protein